MFRPGPFLVQGDRIYPIVSIYNSKGRKLAPSVTNRDVWLGGRAVSLHPCQQHNVERCYDDTNPYKQRVERARVGVFAHDAARAGESYEHEDRDRQLERQQCLAPDETLKGIRNNQAGNNCTGKAECHANR